MGSGSGHAIRRTLNRLPHGGTLPDEIWLKRHHALVALMLAQAAGLAIFAVVQDKGLAHTLLEIGALVPLAAAAILLQSQRRIASLLVATGLISESALLVHIWDGTIEAHFMFFVMILVLSLYEDWVPFLVAAGYVVLHHGLAGTIDPEGVYNHPDAIENPWKWAGVHGFFVAAAGVASVMAWGMNEAVRSESALAYGRARTSEERFRGAFQGAPIGMALASVDPGDAGKLVQVNPAICRILGYGEEELVGKDIRDLVHPEEKGKSDRMISGLIDGSIESSHVERRYVHADGHTVWVDITVSLLRDDDGRPQYALGQIQDATERRRGQEQLVHQAMHDALTGLPNRRKLLADIKSHLPEASDRDPMLLVLFDLDGFKAYNDAFGHPAGDSLLEHLGVNLERAVEGRGSAYRMGGDEFCVLCPHHDEGGSLEADALAALSEEGDSFSISASHGSVLIPADAGDAAEALRVADRRMYARKQSGRASAGRQSADVLLQILAERSADLGEHLDEVTDLCERVAEQLGLPDEETGPLLQAAALHDVGKASIPDEILHKPGPLDDEEWEFMRRHTLIGERIMLAAPALARAAKLVRGSHERWDGGGYPDGLTGVEIPLGARIIAVCDSFDAMTSDRPYRKAMGDDAALIELRRCAGSQFDPEVVEAFAQAVGDRAAGVTTAARG
jgi:diguanylate cyclase (GGDEF)-like protein/PAS domain S-box-containing protein